MGSSGFKGPKSDFSARPPPQAQSPSRCPPTPPLVFYLPSPVVSVSLSIPPPAREVLGLYFLESVFPKPSACHLSTGHLHPPKRSPSGLTPTRSLLHSQCILSSKTIKLLETSTSIDSTLAQQQQYLLPGLLQLLSHWVPHFISGPLQSVPHPWSEGLFPHMALMALHYLGPECIMGSTFHTSSSIHLVPRSQVSLALPEVPNPRAFALAVLATW